MHHPPRTPIPSPGALACVITALTHLLCAARAALIRGLCTARAALIRGLCATRAALPPPLRAALIALATLTALAAPPPAHASPLVPDACDQPTHQQDGPEVFVVTMGPGSDLWSKFGHNGLWIRPADHAHDGLIFNFGVFQPSADMLDDWLEGRQDYMLGVRNFQSMHDYYTRDSRTVVAQRLDLPPDLARDLEARLRYLASPERRVYRYHWCDTNCSTRLRDVLDALTRGALALQHAGPSGVTRHTEVLRHVAVSWPMWFGLRYASMGPKLNAELSWWQAMFIPERLAQRLTVSSLTWPDGTPRPLVAYQCTLATGANAPALPAPPAWGWLLTLLGAAIAALLLALAAWARRPSTPARVLLGLTLILLGLSLGALGVASLWLWTRSVLDAFHYNLNLFQAGPQSLLLCVAGFFVTRGRPTDLRRAWRLTALLALIALLGAAARLIFTFALPAWDVMALFLLINLGAAAALWWVSEQAGEGARRAPPASPTPKAA